MKTGTVHHRSTRGATTFEAVVVLCFLCFVFFAFMQVYQWCMAKIFCQYSAYYAAKGMGLGYKVSIARRAARVAAIAISGQRMGAATADEEDAAADYMTRGDASGVWYRNWYPQSDSEPELHLNGATTSSSYYSNVSLRHAPLLAPQLAPLMGLTENPYPTARADFFNYAQEYLEAR